MRLHLFVSPYVLRRAVTFPSPLSPVPSWMVSRLFGWFAASRRVTSVCFVWLQLSVTLETQAGH